MSFWQPVIGHIHDQNQFNDTALYQFVTSKCAAIGVPETCSFLTPHGIFLK